jgi:hypothetical protein
MFTTDRRLWCTAFDEPTFDELTFGKTAWGEQPSHRWLYIIQVKVHSLLCRLHGMGLVDDELMIAAATV